MSWQKMTSTFSILFLLIYSFYSLGQDRIQNYKILKWKYKVLELRNGVPFII